MFFLAEDTVDFRFPDPRLATPEGLVAVGGDLRVERLISAYRRGIFPWFNEGQPVLWWSPEPRAVLFPGRVHITRSLAKRLRNGGFHVTTDTCFRAVMEGCAAPRRNDPDGGTWIVGAMIEAYSTLYHRGVAHSIECWQGGDLAGGLYGIALGGAFFGESMFSRVSDASKVALVHLARQLEAWHFHFIDCQLPTPHLASLGVAEMSRKEYLRRLEAALAAPDRTGRWRFDEGIGG
ncbi:MAG: leucyl/phenylalanyl-tRNA--protein transferase [Nitrospirota bacterium]|jgi:leucyl/phenylalanyl-tRNA--protein transferase